LGIALKRGQNKPFAIVIDGIATRNLINSAEESEVKIIAAKNFATTDTTLQLMSF